MLRALLSLLTLSAATGDNCASASPNIVVVGWSCMDMISYVPALPAAGETLAGSRFSLGYGGKGANQAVQAAKLGSRVAMVTKVGDDLHGNSTIRNFEAHGVAISHVSRGPPGVSHGVAPITVDQSSGENSIVIVLGAGGLLSPEDVRKAQPAFAEAGRPPGGVLLAQLEVPLETTLEALSLARAADLTTVLNTAPAPSQGLPDALWPLVDIVVANEPELAALAAAPTATNADVEAAAAVLLARGARSVLVTLGPRGCALFNASEAPVFVSAPRVVAPRDTTGAGDAFLGAFAHHLSSGAAIKTALRRANECAAASVEREGTQSSYESAASLAAREASLVASLVDHTLLGSDYDSAEAIDQLVRQAAGANESETSAAAVCVWPQWVPLVRQLLTGSDPLTAPDKATFGKLPMRVATVVNFPHGTADVASVVEEARAAVAAGADEIDLVINHALLARDIGVGAAAAEDLVRAVREATPTTGRASEGEEGEGEGVLLKVIIESGMLGSAAAIRAAAEAALSGGADFVKTSTGKAAVAATPSAAATILAAVSRHRSLAAAGSRGARAGVKIAGGVRNLEQAREYLDLAREWLGASADSPRSFRFGTSSLLRGLREAERGVGGAEQARTSASADVY